MALLQCNFFSQALMRTVPIQVVLPTDKTSGPGGPAAQGPFKTLYLLHGIFGNDTDWVCGTRVQSWAQDRNLAVVMPSGDNSFYVDNPKASAYYGRFIGQELVDFTRRSFPLSTRREDTFLGGLSMGGFGAIVNGLQHPQTFGAVAALSSALILDSMLEHTQYTDFLMTNKGYYESVFGELSQVRGGVTRTTTPWPKRWPRSRCAPSSTWPAAPRTACWASTGSSGTTCSGWATTSPTRRAPASTTGTSGTSTS